MTVSTAPTPLSYAGNGSTTSFPITWKYNAKSHIVATLRSSAGAETVWVLTTNYTLTDPGDTGTLTAVVAPATGQTLLITLEPPNTQSSDIPLGGDFPSVTVEDGLDLSAQRDAKIEALFLRALRVPKTDTQTGSLLELPIDSARASKFLAFDPNGKPIASVGSSDSLGPVTAYINTLLDDATAADARTTLGAVGLTGNETIAGNKTLTGTLASTKSCASGHTRVGPNFCKVNTVTSVALVRDVCTAYPAPAADAKALVFKISANTRSNNAVAQRFASTGVFDTNLCTGVLSDAVSEAYAYEHVAVVAGTILTTGVIETTVFLPTTGATCWLQFTDDTGNQGNGFYDYKGYYD